MTLVEVLAALALLVVLSGGAMAFFFGVTARRDELALLANQRRDVASLLDRLEAALMTSLAVAPDGSAGVRGDRASITVAARAVAVAFEGQVSVADVARVGLEFDASHARCDFTLEPLVGGATKLSEPILSHVAGMRFRYLDGRDWRESFDSLKDGGLPGAVEISIWLEPRSAAHPPALRPASQPPDLAEGPDIDADEPDRIPGEAGFAPPPESLSVELREPDHTRVIVVPDGPDLGWRGGAP
jgi:hypothetical protein